MRKPHPIKAAAVILALGLPNATWALWSPEPTDNMDSDPLSIVSTTPAAAADPKAPLGYTPPLDVRKTDSAAEERTGDPLTHRLFAGRAGEVIETPGFGGETVTGGTFTRVNPANILANRKKAAAAGRVTDTPIPDPATYWLLLSALPALLVARRRLPGRSLP